MFKNRAMHFIHFNVDSALPKTEEMRHLSKVTNDSEIGGSEAQLDGSVLSNGVAIEGYNLIRLNCFRERGRVACFMKHSVVTVIKPIFVLTQIVFLQRYIYLNQNYSW